MIDIPMKHTNTCQSMVLRRELSIGFYDRHDHAFAVKNSKKNEIIGIYYVNGSDLPAVSTE